METIKQRDVSTAQDLIAAVRDRSVDRIVVFGDLAGLSSLELLPDKALTAAARATLQFKDDSDGIRLSSNNKLENLTLIAAPEKRAIFNDTTVTDLGCLELRNLTLTGAVQILAADRVRSGHVEAHNIDIVSADTRGYEARPKAYGVEVITGAFTIWNQQLDPSTAITPDLTEISTGRPNSPVRGSGIFVSGASETGGRLIVRRLETGVIHCDAGIAHGTPDRISAGVFTSYGAIVDLVRTRGRVTTYGPNDMALDNWGVVDRWISEEKITTYGPSGIGLVNIGAINSLTLNGPIETFGRGARGARGFNVYSGTLKFAEFDRIVTRGNGAVGIQISQPVGEISVRRGIETFGGSGESLVKGVMTNLPAIAFSVKAGGAVRALTVAGGLTTHGSAIAPLDVEGSVESLFLKGGVTTSGG